MKLLLDSMCGGIASYLRMCGHDTAYTLDRGIEADDAIIDLVRTEQRLLISRDRQLVNRVERSIYLETTDPIDQLTTLAAAGIELKLAAEPDYCGACNGPLQRVPETAETPAETPAPETTTVYRCQDCRQYFWRGSHWDRVAETLATVRTNA